MKTQKPLRIFFTGVGGQGTLTATTLLARVALDAQIEVVAGEIHGMAQRGGVVESTVMLGGLKSPKIAHGEADILMGFEALETLRALPYLRQGGIVFSSAESMAPTGVSLGQASMPPLSTIETAVRQKASKAVFLPIRSIGVALGAAQAGNTALLGALCASGLLSIDTNDLVAGIQRHIPGPIGEINAKAALEGQAAYLASQR